MWRLVPWLIGALAILIAPAHADGMRIVGSASAGIYFSGPDGTPRGLAVDVVEAIFAKLQEPYEIVILPPGRATMEIERGEAQVLVGANKRTIDFGKVRMSSQPIFVDHLVLVARADAAPSWNGDLNSFPDLKIATIRGVEYGERLDVARHNLKLDEREDLDTALRLLAASRVDLVLTDLRSFNDAVTRLGQQDRFVVMQPEFDRIAAYFRFADGAELDPFITRFNAALDDLVLDGVIADLNRRYNLRF